MASDKITPGIEYVPLFQSIGLNSAKAVEAAKSAKSASALKDIIERHDLGNRKPPLDDRQTSLVVALAGKVAKSSALTTPGSCDYVLSRILDASLTSMDQVTAATRYVESNPLPIDDADFDAECGVGFLISSGELYDRVNAYVSGKKPGGWADLGAAISVIKATPDLRWASPLDVKNAVEKVFVDVFGPRTAAKPKAKEHKKPAKTPARSREESEAAEAVSASSVFEEGFLGNLHKPGDNPQIGPSLREAHLAATSGQVWTRFPPEPNGYLHIGHSKAIFVNFGYAAHHNGKCYLRYDDTNPEKEEERYFESILEMVRWLGFEPWKVTYSSDYFDELYALAVRLIEYDKAYVCHCTQEQIKADRGEKTGQKPRACIHRSRPISESLLEFENMKNGKYRPKEANLRMKQDLEDGNPQMWDLTAYRVLDTPHHRTGSKWCIYPTYDFTHCLVDSIENISHSLCTTEFILSRQSYEWLCDAVKVYKPRQYEYGRLSLEGTIMSKRKILALVDKGYVSGWDDPRLYTLIALRRRGVPPGAILSFVSGLGVSTAASNTELSRFEQSVRQYLEGTVPRLLMVLHPLKVVLENLPEDFVLMVEKPLHPKVPKLGSATIPLTRTIYIDADDFRLEDSKDYFRLAPGKTVGLFQAPFPITYVSHTTDEAGNVTELVCRAGNEGQPKKPKAYIQWVAEHAPMRSPVRINEVRVVHQLFKSGQPSANFLDDVDTNSLEVVKSAMVEVGFLPLAKKAMFDARKESRARMAKATAQHGAAASEAMPHVSAEQLAGKENVRFQGLRVGYFAVDSDSRVACLDDDSDTPAALSQGDYLVLNKIVGLKEDAGKAS
ncbi:glutamine-tRNA ligase [Fistulina hepatica ATCC 64428]|nr:glutamine-tRNA ligase [Fistulina hepatica ATCC 64428]